ncbi:CDP-alcohol phosphatidyltransferase family protein [Lysobacter solisilvae (ex Woo and Kim 2020)]|uniref:CDP-alcohol phosphatidyltransferase family protein n=1 Tax=Agrilutibacter terrestris TaxID=2865112 RepID=A0A7H0FZW9_9GAMM|nr:CDP-alcohol phosphatidyltransferase family protein [Lysobacter terrestris]QNP41585.1 CDP-alcohol phosphatidyltransferase family protein [Lysobacter terrestris]
MASIYALKSRFQALLRPLVRRLHAWGVTANQVTVLAALASLVVAALVSRAAGAQPLWFALLPAWMFVRMALNAVDGMLAREFGQQSRPGAYLNELGDVVADGALYLSLLAIPGLPAWLPWLFAWLAALTEYAGVLGLMVGAQRRYDGPMGKSDRAFVVGVVDLLLACGVPAGAWTGGVLAVACALCVATVVNRVRAGLRQAQDAA